MNSNYIGDRQLTELLVCVAVYLYTMLYVLLVVVVVVVVIYVPLEKCFSFRERARIVVYRSENSDFYTHI